MRHKSVCHLWKIRESFDLLNRFVTNHLVKLLNLNKAFK